MTLKKKQSANEMKRYICLLSLAAAKKRNNREKMHFNYRIQSLVKTHFCQQWTEKKEDKKCCKCLRMNRWKGEIEAMNREKVTRSFREERSAWFSLNISFNGLITPDADTLMQWLFGKYHQPFWLVLTLRAEHLIGHRACQSWRSGRRWKEKCLICHWA